MRTSAILVAMAVVCGLAATAPRQTTAKRQAARKGDDINKPFLDPKLDVPAYVKKFESDSREIYAKRNEIVAAVAPKPGEAVADLGAGTGLFTALFAAKVGKTGHVYAVDISKPFLKHIEDEAKKTGREAIITAVLGSADATNLEPESVDAVFICDVYHHFAKPEKMLASIRQSLKPGGRVILIDFDLSDRSSEFVKHHARAAKEVYFREFEKAGFARAELKDAPKLKEDFIAQFRKPKP